jgi:hypothetical protein
MKKPGCDGCRIPVLGLGVRVGGRSYLREREPLGCRRRTEARRTASPRRTIRSPSGLPVGVAASSVLVGGRVTFGVPSTPSTSPLGSVCSLVVEAVDSLVVVSSVVVVSVVSSVVVVVSSVVVVSVVSSVVVVVSSVEVVSVVSLVVDSVLVVSVLVDSVLVVSVLVDSVLVVSVLVDSVLVESVLVDSVVVVSVADVVVVVVDSVQFSEFDFEVYVLVPATSDAKTIRTPPEVAVKPDVIGSVKLSGLDLPSRSIVISLSWTFPAGEAFEPLFAAR